ncbi:hypothetical protein [Arthrobacter sp. A5]|uniref:hypothetical protein n=1 Tax=Arthrobacter sp. A5 TaxID=576926 RepID=UPI003DAA0706
MTSMEERHGVAKPKDSAPQRLSQCHRNPSDQGSQRRDQSGQKDQQPDGKEGADGGRPAVVDRSGTDQQGSPGRGPCKRDRPAASGTNKTRMLKITVRASSPEAGDGLVTVYFRGGDVRQDRAS